MQEWRMCTIILVMNDLDIDLNETADVVVGRNLRELRSIHRLSLKALADISGLNI